MEKYKIKAHVTKHFEVTMVAESEKDAIKMVKNFKDSDIDAMQSRSFYEDKINIYECEIIE